MNLLPQNPKTRNMALIIIAVVLALFLFAFLYIYYFAPAADEAQKILSTGDDSQSLSEQAIKKIERDITAIETEMKNDFYKSLRKYIWTPDAAAPGNENPFFQQ